MTTNGNLDPTPSSLGVIGWSDGEREQVAAGVNPNLISYAPPEPEPTTRRRKASKKKSDGE